MTDALHECIMKARRFSEDAGIFDRTVEFPACQETVLARADYYHITVIGRAHRLFEWLCYGAIYLHSFLKL